MADTAWQVASSFAVQDPGDVEAIAPALASVGAATIARTDLCVTLFPTGTHDAGSSVSDQNLECEAAMLAAPDATAARVSAEVAARGNWLQYVIDSITAVLGTAGVATGVAITTATGEDPQHVQRVNEFLSRRTASKSSISTSRTSAPLQQRSSPSATPWSAHKGCPRMTATNSPSSPRDWT